MTLLLSLLGCDAGEKTTLPGGCPDPATTPNVAACFDGPRSDTGPTYGDVEAEWTGAVAEIGSGAFPSACTYTLGTDATASGWWARLPTVDGDVFVGLDTLDAGSVTVGQTITVKGHYSPMDFGPLTASVEVRDETGVLVGWAGTAATPEDLDAPAELAFATGAAVCDESDDCGEWAGHDLEVTVGGDTTTVEHDETATVAGYPIAIGALEKELASGTCPDWFVAIARVGVGAKTAR